MPTIESYEIQVYDQKHKIIRNGEVTPIHHIRVGDKFKLRGVKGTYRCTHEIMEDRHSSDVFILAVNLIQ